MNGNITKFDLSGGPLAHIEPMKDQELEWLRKENEELREELGLKTKYFNDEISFKIQCVQFLKEKIRLSHQSKEESK